MILNGAGRVITLVAFTRRGDLLPVCTTAVALGVSFTTMFGYYIKPVYRL